MTEIKAMKALRNGSEEALGWFIERYTGYVAAVVNNIMGDSHPVEDVEETVSDVFVALWYGCGSIKSAGVKSWLARVARNKALDTLRRGEERTLPLEEDRIVISVPGPEDELFEACDRWVVQEAVFAMPHPDREIFLRYYFYFQRIDDIAAAMNIPANTVKTRLRRGREKLKACLERIIQEAHL